MFETIQYERSDKIVTLKINRPEAGNAFHSSTYGEVIEAMKMADSDPDVQVIILTGIGKHFCAGGDIGEFSQLLKDNQPIPQEMVLKTGEMIKSVLKNSKPVIAAVNGSAAGAGLGLVLACDFIIMEESSVLHTAFSKIAFPGDTGLIYSLQQAIGTFKSKEHVMLGTPITADLADSYNLLYKVAKDGDLLIEAVNLAEKLQGVSSNALKLQKDLFASIYYPELDDFNANEAEAMHQASKHKDHLEAVKNFLAKKK